MIFISILSYSMNTIFIDLETTGLPRKISFYCYYNPKYITYYNSSRITEIGYCIVNQNGKEIKQFNSLVKPNRFKIKEIRNKKGELINDITHEKAMKEGRDLGDIFKEMRKDLKNCNLFVAHNTAFDYNVLLSECHRANNDILVNCLLNIKRVCTKRMFGNRSLLMSYQKLFGYKPEEKHRALYDASLCKDIYYKLIDLQKREKENNVKIIIPQMKQIMILLVEINFLLQKKR